MTREAETHSIRAVIGDATPGGGRADVTSVVVGQEGLNAHELRKAERVNPEKGISMKLAQETF